jgi:predicted dehydrogenase
MNNRRSFLQNTGLTGIGLAVLNSINSFAGQLTSKNQSSYVPKSPHFNMSGFAAPKLETVRIGYIGLGNRGSGAIKRIKHIDGVEVVALCDVRPEKANAAKKTFEGTKHNPEVYTDKPENWKKMCERPDIDLVYICTPWALHTPMAVYTMNQGKHVCVEVPAAKTIDECWQMVETSERTKKHCVMLENTCYDFFELMTLNMIRQGLFGELVHGEGAYIHTLLEQNFQKDSYYNMWRLKENMRNGNLYPTHGLGPVAQALNINRGDKMDYLVAMSSADFQMGKMANEMASKDDFYKPFANKKFRGNMNTTTIRTNLGKTIMLQHDVSTVNVYSRIHKLSGTKGICLKYPNDGRIAFKHDEWVSAEEMKKLAEQYEPPIVKKVGELAKGIGGHGGMDFMMDWRLIDCLRNGLALDMDVYDAASWSAVAPLSEWSVANRSNSINFPDFTRGSWKKNQPIDTSLSTGGTTKILA